MVRRFLLALIIGGVAAAAPVVAQMSVTTIGVGELPDSVAVDTTTGYIYVSNLNGSAVSVIDGATNEAIATIPVAAFPRAITANPVTGRIYVFHDGGGTSVIDRTTGTIIATIDHPATPSEEAAVNPTTNRVYATSTAAFSVTVIDGATNTLATTIPIGAQSSGVAVNPVTNTVYVAGRNGTVSIIDGATNAVVATLAVGGRLAGVAVNPATNKAYAIDSGDINDPDAPGRLFIIDGATRTLESTVDAGPRPHAVAVNPTTNRLYVANVFPHNTVAARDASDGHLIETVSVGTHPAGIAANPSTHTVYTANAFSNTVSVISDPPPANHAPVPVADTATISEDTLIELNVLANDVDEDGDELFLHALGQPGHGVTSITADGRRILYVPQANNAGNTSFQYAIRDAAGATSPPVTVTINIIPVNDTPTAVADIASTAEGAPVTIHVEHNDVDIDGDILIVSAVSQPANGVVTIPGTSTVLYRPAAEFSGTDMFSYTVIDGSGATASATVTVTVVPVNDAPAAHGQAVLVLQGRPQPVTLGASDADGDPVTFSIVDGPAHGTLEGNAPGLIYRPASGYAGPDSFTFAAYDGSATSNLATVTIDVSATVWDVTGPDTGTVVSMASGPASSMVVYAQTVRALWKSMDGGVTWSLVLRLPNGNQGLAVDQSSSLIVYAGAGNGIQKSTDGGATWQTYQTGLSSTSVRALAVDPFGADVLFAATSQGVFTSIDGGVSWAKVGSLTQAFDLWMDPASPNTLYALANAGLMKSVDGGSTWTSIQTGLGGPAVSLAPHPKNPGALFALTSGAGVFATTDGGATWQARNNGLNTQGLRAIVLDPAAPDTIYVTAGSSVYRTTTAGALWSTVHPQFNTFGLGPLAVHRGAPGRVLVGADAGVLRSTNSGVVWTRSATGMRGGRTTVVAADPLAPGTTFAGTYETGPFKTTDVGVSWSAPLLPNPGGLRAMVTSPHEPRRAFIGMTCGGLARSSDGGATWAYGAPGVSGSFCVNALAADPTTPGVVLAGTTAGLVYRTATNGDAWTPASDGLPGNRIINALAFDPTTPGVAYAATGGGGVFKSSDGGATWTASNTGLTALGMTAMTVDPATGVVYAGSDNTFGSASVFRSTNGGASWTPAGLNLARIGALLVDPARGRVYAGVSYTGGALHGVYASDDGGATWTALTRKGLITTDIRSLALESGRLFAGAWDGSVGVLRTASTPVITVPGELTVEATGPGTIVTFDVSATDDDDPSPLVTCTPASGSVFALGATAVSCTASNAAGNTATASFMVTVRDFSLPVLSGVPGDLSVEATGPTGAVATWLSPAAHDVVDGAVPVACAPASGSTFPGPGTTVVTCTAFDPSGNTSMATFTVTVRDTTRPSIFVDAPRPDDAVAGGAPMLVRVLSNDATGVARVKAGWRCPPPGYYGICSDGGLFTNLTRVSGTVQQGTWEGHLNGTEGPFVVFVTVEDQFGNVGSQSIHVDNDGIDHHIDRARADHSQDFSTVYSSEFNSGTTSGSIQRLGGRVLASGLAGGGVRLTLAKTGGDGSVSSWVHACADPAKQIFLDTVGQVLDIKCNGATLEATAIVAPQPIVVRKLTTFRCGFTCGYQLWIYTSLGQGQGFSTGSPTAADPGNTDPLHVTFVQVAEDGTETVIGFMDLDPGESADPQIVAGPVEGSEFLSVEVLAGEVPVTLGGETRTLSDGETLTVPVAKAAQTITFDAIANQTFGAGPFALTAAASSGLPVSFIATGSCTVAGTIVTLIGPNACTLTAAQPGDDVYQPAAAVSRTFFVFYSWSDILPPLAPSGTSTARLGSTVPVKFQLTGASSGVTSVVARLYVTKVSDAVVEGAEVPAVSNGPADTGNVFRYDAGARQYVFNWSTKDLSEGTWRLRVDLLDGSTRTVLVGLKK